MIFTVAIDGPAAAGKGTISRAIADRFGFAHLDTGALYRAVGVKGGDPVLAAQSLSPQDLARPDLRTLEAGQAASRVAVIPAVRAALLDYQRRVARQDGGAVLDGRDIGTVICPMAEVKLFVTASPEVRARRRWLELGGPSAPKPYEAVLAEVVERDDRDMNRADAPLRPAPDAVVIDTSTLRASDAIALATAHVGAALAARKGQPARQPARMVFHLPAQHRTRWQTAPHLALYARIAQVMQAAGQEVALGPAHLGRKPPQDGDLHIVEGGHRTARGYLNAALAYLPGFWHLDPEGVLADSSARHDRFDPAAVDPAQARAFCDGLRARFVTPRLSRYQQPRTTTALPPGAIAVFLQGPGPASRGQTFMTDEALLRATVAAAGDRPVLVKLHPLSQEHGLRTLAGLADDGLELPPVDGNVHDILAACAVTISHNSATAIEGMLHGKPAIICGRADFAQLGLAAPGCDDIAPALHAALTGPGQRDAHSFDAGLYWYFSRHTLDIDSPGFEDRLFAHLARFGFPRERFGLPPLARAD